MAVLRERYASLTRGRSRDVLCCAASARSRYPLGVLHPGAKGNKDTSNGGAEVRMTNSLAVSGRLTGKPELSASG